MSEREKYEPDPQDALPDQPADDRRRGRGYYRSKFKRAKRMALSPFRKVKKLWTRKNSSSHSGNGCYLCFMPPPRSLNSPMTSRTNEPGEQKFSNEFLKALMEKNDFYCEECNVHRDE